jgi:hypothetical protein
MGLRSWVRKLERDAGDLHGTLRLPGGTVVRYGRKEMLDALLAAIEGREHRLLPYLRQIPSSEGMPGMIRAIEGSGQRVS